MNESAANGHLSTADALMMGLLQGPTELLPISSSGHLVLAPWLLGSPYMQLDPELRKAFEVALHVGTAGALLIVLRGEVAGALSELDSRRIALLTLSFVPAAVAALLFERQIERYASRPEVVAIGLIGGALVMLAAERAPQLRRRNEAGALDGLALGLAQATALVPGVSRNGATLIAARLRHFAARDANQLSRHAALPVIFGAAALKGVRLARRGLPAQARRGFALGAAASFASSLASVRLIERFERRRSLKPYAAYRIALGAAVLAVAAGRRRRDAR